MYSTVHDTVWVLYIHTTPTGLCLDHKQTVTIFEVLFLEVKITLNRLESFCSYSVMQVTKSVFQAVPKLQQKIISAFSS